MNTYRPCCEITSQTFYHACSRLWNDLNTGYCDQQCYDNLNNQCYNYSWHIKLLPNSILNTVYYLFCAFIHITIFTLRLQLIFSDEFFISFRILVYSLTASVRSANEQTFSFFEYTLRSQQPFPPEMEIQMCQSGTKAMPIPPCLSQRFRQKVS